MRQIPKYVYEVAETLEKNGFEAYLVGGSLRDILMDIEPNDYDLTTNALPDEILKIFPKSVPTGVKYGTVTVLTTDESGEYEEVEVTTFRSEKDYVGGRWPSHVEFSKDIMDDLKRRDFTVNAMALRLNLQSSMFNVQSKETIEGSRLVIEDLLDPFQGQKDLEAKIIRAVGNPTERFKEDGLRAMRACRLASVLGFEIEENTLKAISETLEVAAMVSLERVQVELKKLVEESPKPSVGLELMRKTGLLNLYIPELLEGYGMEQNEHHVHDVYQHALDTADVAPKEVRFAGLFHDIGKSRTKDGAHFYSHDQVGAEMTKEILNRLKFPKSFIDQTARLVRWHMFYLPERDEEEELSHHIPIKKEKRLDAFKNGWSDAAIRRLIRRVGGQENVDNLIKLRIADAVANPKASFDPADIQGLAERVAEIREQDSAISLKDLQIRGEDLIELGIPAGPKIREILNHLLEEVTENIELNEKEKLIQEAKRIINL